MTLCMCGCTLDRAMNAADLRQERLAEWIDTNLGPSTLKEFAADVTAATGWAIDHSRLGRYRNRKLQVGPSVIAHFNDYAGRRGLAPVSLVSLPAASPDPLASALMALTAELGEWRREREALRSELDALKALVGQLGEERLSAQGHGVPAAPAALPR